MKQDFFTPRLSGGRFRENTVPVEVLPDISALQELLTELAKDYFKEQNPDRKRAPKNFERAVQIHLAAVEDGSAKLKLVLFFAGLLPPYTGAFEHAKDVVTEAVAAASKGEQPRLEQRFLRYFGRIGRSLEADESLGFPVNDGYADLNQVTRHRLMEASQMAEWSEKETLRARLSSTNVRTDKYEIHLLDGSTLNGDLTPHLRDQMQAAHIAYGKNKDEWLSLQCIVLKDRSGRINRIESVQDISPLEQLDVPLRLVELANLTDGWLDGDGIAPTHEGLEWLSGSFDTQYAPDLQLPYLYPTPEGNVQAEWNLGDWSVSVVFDLRQRSADFQALHLKTDESLDEHFDLDVADGWLAVNQALRSLGMDTVAAAR